MEKLTPGSRCVVYSLSSNEIVVKSSGIFRGFVALGEDTSICLELDENHGEKKGILRLIPLGAIASIDVIELAELHEEDDEEEKIYYS
ncbi:MAG: hypothetical protein J7L63_02650 [Thermoplasmata archaeon]|nr:hypothetical protein [Thermoplasmata archaeon]